jgi:hypothetical protein
MTRRITNFEIFVNRKNDSLDESFKKEFLEWASLNEASMMDEIKNKLSKSLFGDFSKLGVIDTIRKGNFDVRKEMLEKKYDTEEDLEDLYLKKTELKRKGNQSALQTVDSQIEKKRQELVTFNKTAQSKINRGLDLLKKAIGENRRRKEYYEVGLKEDELKLAEFEYELAKKRSLDSTGVNKLKARIQKARKEADSLVSSLVNKKTKTP